MFSVLIGLLHMLSFIVHEHAAVHQELRLALQRKMSVTFAVTGFEQVKSIIYSFTESGVNLSFQLFWVS